MQFFKGHTDTVEQLAWSSPESLLVTASADRTVRFWDPRTSKAVRCLNMRLDTRLGESPPLLAGGENTCVGNRVRVGAGGAVLDFDVRVLSSSAVPIHSTKDHPTTFSGDAEITAFCDEYCADEDGNVFGVSTGQTVAGLPHSNAVTSLCTLRDDGWIVSTAMDGTVRFCKQTTPSGGAAVGYYRTLSESVKSKSAQSTNPPYPLCGALHVGTQRVLVGCGDGTVHVVSAVDINDAAKTMRENNINDTSFVVDEVEAVLAAHVGSACVGVHVQQSTGRILTASHGGQVTLWDGSGLLLGGDDNDVDLATEIATCTVVNRAKGELLNDVVPLWESTYTTPSTLALAVATTSPNGDNNVVVYPLGLS
eukprot:PhM_4_TR7741/c0_g1_i2/m.49882